MVKLSFIILHISVGVIYYIFSSFVAGFNSLHKPFLATSVHFKNVQSSIPHYFVPVYAEQSSVHPLYSKQLSVQVKAP